MDFQLPFPIPPASGTIHHKDLVVLSGSCFTEHIGNYLQEGKMQALVNPYGILFNPGSIADSLQACISQKQYQEEDVFYLNETWNNWAFHSRFTHTEKDIALKGMNDAVTQAHDFLQKANWLMITFGSAFQYFLKPGADNNMLITEPYGVANCHKAPGKWFDKQLLGTETMLLKWEQTIKLLQLFNPDLKIIFTVSPVRHYRDGLVENNRSKARLLELVHTLIEKEHHCYYFPAYELVVDVLRDYRFFKQDMVHPNDMAIQYVWEQFVGTYMDNNSKDLIKRIGEITIAARHELRFPHTAASQRFKTLMLDKIEGLEQQHSWLNLEAEKNIFS